jgi:hypothetical protein
MAAEYESSEGKTLWISNNDPSKPLSRYNKTRLYINKDGFPVQESWELDYAEQLEDQWFDVTLEFSHRPDLIATVFYGSEQLYWVIAYANAMIDPVAETYTGRRLRIPNRDYVYQQLLAK